MINMMPSFILLDFGGLIKFVYVAISNAKYINLWINLYAERRWT